jgi:hypothetical protein
MVKTLKKPKAKTCIIIAIFLVLVIVISVFAINFKNKYNGSDPEEVAVNFVSTIVERGDGYNAYQNTLVRKNCKYSDFIRQNFMYPIIYVESNYQIGMDTHNLKGLDDKSYMGEKTKNDDGTLETEVINRMYPIYVQLIKNYDGWDKYNTFYTIYFSELVNIREEIFGDKYLTDDFMFTVLEANVKSYGDELAGFEESASKNEITTPGIYEIKYGEDYAFTYEITETTDIELEEYQTHVDEYSFKTYGISVEDIDEVKAIRMQIKVGEETVVEEQKVLVVKIDGQWYVDNTNTNTTALYTFYK